MDRKNIVIIGSGNVATHLAIAFLKAGHRILSVISRNQNNAAQIGEKTRSSYSSDYNSIPDETDFIISKLPSTVSPLIFVPTKSRPI